MWPFKREPKPWENTTATLRVSLDFMTITKTFHGNEYWSAWELADTQARDIITNGVRDGNNYYPTHRIVLVTVEDGSEE